MAAVNLGVLEAILRLKDEMSGQVTKATSSVSSSFARLDKKFQESTAVLQRYAGPLGLAAVGGAALKLVNDVRQVGTELVDLSSKTGISLKGLQELKFASEQVGVGFEQTTGAVVRMGRRLAAELPEATKWMETLGLETSAILELEPAEGFEAIVKAIAEIENPAQQAAAAMGIFGDAGLQILPLIRSDLDATIERFGALGGVIEDEVLLAGKKLDDSLTDLSASWSAMTAQWGGALIPVAQKFVEVLTKIPLYIELMARGFVASVATMIANVLELAAKIPVIGKKFKGVAEEVRTFATYYQDQTTATWLAVDALDELQAGQTIATKAIKETEVASKELAARLKEMSAAGLAYAAHMKALKAQAETMAQTAWDSRPVKEMGEAIRHVNMDFGATPAAQRELVAAGMSMNEVFGATTRVMGDVGNILSIFGVEVDSTIGKATRLISTFMSLADSLKGLGGLIKGVGGFFSKLFGGGGPTAGLPAMGLQAGTATGTSFLGGFGTTVSSGFSSLGATLAPLFTNPFTIAVGGILGAFFGLKALFGGPSNFERAGEELGNAFGSEFDEALRWHIVNQAEELGIGMQESIQRNLGEVSKRVIETGGDMDALAQRMRDTFAFVERGEIDAADAAGILQSSVAQILPHIDQMGASGRAALEGIVADAINMGVQFEGLQALAAALGLTIGQEISDGADKAAQSIVNLANKIADIDASNIGGGGGGGGGRGRPKGSEFISAQSGFDSGVLTKPTLFPRILAHPGERLSVKSDKGQGVNVSYTPRNNVVVQQGDSPAEMERKILDVLIPAVRNDTKSIVGEITRKQARS